MPVTKQTLDLLDAELTSGYLEHMALDDAIHEKTYRQTLAISPKYWEEYGPRISGVPLAWQWVRYKELNSHLKTELTKNVQSGIYLFVVKPTFLIEGLPGFVFYVGISGEHGSNRPLQDRLSDYLRLESVKKRQAVHRGLKMYYDYTWVCYSLTDLSFKDLMELEETLHGFFVPWAGKRDFPVRIKAARAAWGN